MSQENAQENGVMPNIFSPAPIEFSDDLDKLKKLVYLFSCHQKVVGRSTVIIREKLITLLSLYLQYGYSKQTKILATEVLDVPITSINSMNKEIRDLGLLHKSERNTRNNYLTKDLEILKGYLEAEDPDQALFLLRLQRAE